MSARLLSLHLILELEAQRTSRWEDKMGVQWEEQGQGAATNMSWAPWAQSDTSTCSNCPCPWWCGVGDCLQSWGQTHICPGSQSSWRRTGEGWALPAPAAATSHRETKLWVSEPIPVRNGCCFTSTLQVSHKNLSRLLLWEIERKVVTLENYHAPIFFSSLS